jgi:hypothetical protein
VCLCVLQDQKTSESRLKFRIDPPFRFVAPLYVMLARRSHLEEGLKELVSRATHRKNVITKMTVFKVQRGRPCRCSEGASQEESDVDSVTTV